MCAGQQHFSIRKVTMILQRDGLISLILNLKAKYLQHFVKKLYFLELNGLGSPGNYLFS